jgi:hypothetical protein
MSFVSLQVSLHPMYAMAWDSLDTVKCGKEDHLGITIFTHGLDMFPQLLEDLLSVLHIS